MHFVYRAADSNGKETAQIYLAKFPNRHHSHHSIFASIHRWLRMTGKLTWDMTDIGSQRSVRMPEEEILDLVAKNSKANTRNITKKG